MSKETPRQVADRLATWCTERAVQTAAGGAEQDHAAYKEFAGELRWMADTALRVTRKMVYGLSRRCAFEAQEARHNGNYEYAEAAMVIGRTIWRSLYDGVWPADSIGGAR